MKDISPQSIAASLVEELKRARLSLGLSHAELAARAGISRAGLSFIESHKRAPTLLTCLKLAGAMDLRLADVLGRLEKQVACAAARDNLPG